VFAEAIHYPRHLFTREQNRDNRGIINTVVQF
jgi:hypothetical protein